MLTDSLPCDFVVNRNLLDDDVSSDSNTVELSPRSTMDANSFVDDELHTDAVLNHALSADFWLYNSEFNEEREPSDSDTVILSRCSSTDDLTIAYRSPVSNVLDFDEPSVDERERSGGSLEAGSVGEMSSMIASDIDQELKAVSNAYCDEVISQPYCTTVSGLMQSPSNAVKSSESLTCGLVTSSVNSEQLQTTPVQLVGSATQGFEKQSAVNSSSCEFADKGSGNVKRLLHSVVRLS